MFPEPYSIIIISHNESRLFKTGPISVIVRRNRVASDCISQFNNSNKTLKSIYQSDFYSFTYFIWNENVSLERMRTRKEEQNEMPGEVTWNHAGGWSLKPTPLEVMACWRGGKKTELGGGRRDIEKYRALHTCTLHACPPWSQHLPNFCMSAFVPLQTQILWGFWPYFLKLISSVENSRVLNIKENYIVNYLLNKLLNSHFCFSF